MSYIEDRIEVFNRICPPLYQDTDPARLTAYSRSILALPYPKTTGQGALFMGKTRTGKTRTAWLLARNWFIPAYRTLMAFNGGSFSRAVADNYGKGTATEWHDNLKTADILVLDDIFKTRITDAVQDALFSVVEDRMAYRLPTILTLNSDAHGLSGVISDDFFAPLVGRLNECCETYLFEEKLASD